MKRLILMRHAKSSWADAGQRDHDRPLNDRGRRDAPVIGDWMAANGFMPDFALISSAVRTQETWATLGPRFQDVVAQLRPDLYEAAPGRYLAALRTAPDVDCVLMLGHMPSIGAFAHQMLATPPDSADFAKYPTSATTVVDLDIRDWQAADLATGDLKAFATPKSLD